MSQARGGAYKHPHAAADGYRSLVEWCTTVFTDRAVVIVLEVLERDPARAAYLASELTDEQIATATKVGIPGLRTLRARGIAEDHFVWFYPWGRP